MGLHPAVYLLQTCREGALGSAKEQHHTKGQFSGVSRSRTNGRSIHCMHTLAANRRAFLLQRHRDANGNCIAILSPQATWLGVDATLLID